MNFQKCLRKKNSIEYPLIVVFVKAILTILTSPGPTIVNYKINFLICLKASKVNINIRGLRGSAHHFFCHHIFFLNKISFFMNIMTCFFFQNALNDPTPPTYYNHQQQKLVDRILCSPYSIKFGSYQTQKNPSLFFWMTPCQQTLPRSRKD